MSSFLTSDDPGARIPSRFVDAEDALHETAMAMSGHDDFGDPAYRQGLRVLLQAMDAECPMTPQGRVFAFFELAMALNARLVTEAGWKAFPELLRTRIEAPLVITGLPRSSTTVLHRLLAVDPQFQGLESWLANAPMPRPPREQWGEIPAFRASDRRLEKWFETVPQFRAAHNMAVDDMEECIEVLRQDFATNRFGCNFDVPTYDRWWMSRDELPSYRRFADVLRLIGGREPGRRWLLKNPGHIYSIDALLAVFPDARIVYTHRDPLRAIPSVASLIHLARRIPCGDAASKNTGPRELAVWSRGTQPMLRARQRHPRQFHDVQQRDFLRDPMGVVAAVYAAFDLRPGAGVEDAMRAWLERNRQGAHGEHRYTLEEYGLSAGDVRERFRDYIDAYGPF